MVLRWRTMRTKQIDMTQLSATLQAEPSQSKPLDTTHHSHCG